jgi:hypothetical protein
VTLEAMPVTNITSPSDAEQSRSAGDANPAERERQHASTTPAPTSGNARRVSA